MEILWIAQDVQDKQKEGLTAENLDVGKNVGSLWKWEMYEICIRKWENMLIREAEYSGVCGSVTINAKNS